MERGLILLDIDKTVINSDFQITDNGLAAKIQELQKRGWTIGINSDRPFLSLMPFKKQLGMNGPIICELGNIVYIPIGNRCHWVAPELKTKFDALFTAFVSHCKESFPGVPLMLGDGAALSQLLCMLRPEQPTSLIMLNSLRRASFAFNVKQLNGRGLEGNTALLTELSQRGVALFQEIFQVDPLYYVDSLVYHSCIMHFPESTKTMGVKNLLEFQAFPRIAMIGDTRFDFLDIPGAIHCAVGNAYDEYKVRCDFVADREIAAGAGQCLDWIDANF